MTWTEYAEHLEAKPSWTCMHASIQERTERCPSPPEVTYRRRMQNSDRCGIAAIEDKIVQAAVVAILTPIYEAEFLGFSYRVPTEAQPGTKRWMRSRSGSGSGGSTGCSIVTFNPF